MKRRSVILMVVLTIVSLGFYLPATLEIRTSYMLGIFNRQVTHRHGIQFYDLAGTTILEAYQSPCTDVPSDTVVSFGSVNAIPLESRRFNAIHSDLTISAPVFEEFVRPLLQKPAGSFTPAADPPPPSTTSAPLQFTRVYNGHVDPGGSTELAINIDANVSVASFALYDPTRSVTVSVRGASGIGKGKRSEAVKEALREHRALYFGATGGAGALLARTVVAADVIAYEDLGPEAVMRLEVKDMPLFVINDIYGNDLYEAGTERYKR